MKKLINCATKTQIVSRIVDGFNKAGCYNINILEQTDRYCALKLTLPSGNITTTTVWYDYNSIKNGQRQSTSLQKWDASYKVNSDGDVYDKNGNLIGEAYVRTNNGYRQSTKKNYQYRSIRTDSGDVVIDHPEKAHNYNLVVNTLEHRVINKRS